MAKKTKKTVQRIPRYVDHEGFYLAVDDRDWSIKIGWFDPTESEFGLYLANEHHREKTGETNTAVEVVKDHYKERGYELPGHGQEFNFDTAREAQAVLRVINARLHYMRDNKPLPDWAKKALAEGWSPPKGWKP